MSSTPNTISGKPGKRGNAGKLSPAQRTEALRSKIFLIAHKFQLSDQSTEDIAHTMIERVLTRCVEDPSFIKRDDGYWLRYANWMGYHLLNKSMAYNRHTIVNPATNQDITDPYEPYENSIELSPDSNPEAAYESKEVQEAINSLSPDNRKLAAMLIIGFTKSEIARAFGISRSAISQRLGTIEKKLISMF
jgi:RNA polymerase sigma factor (sigma-70 family)